MIRQAEVGYGNFVSPGKEMHLSGVLQGGLQSDSGRSPVHRAMSMSACVLMVAGCNTQRPS